MKESTAARFELRSLVDEELLVEQDGRSRQARKKMMFRTRMNMAEVWHEQAQAGSSRYMLCLIHFTRDLNGPFDECGKPRARVYLSGRCVFVWRRRKPNGG